MDKHTPGPWRINDAAVPYLGGIAIDATDPADEEVFVVAAVLGIDDSRIVDARTEANARLVAAAPDLLAEIEREYEELANIRNQWPGRHTREGQAKLCRLCCLIASATGRDEKDVQDDFTNRAVAREFAEGAAQ